MEITEEQAEKIIGDLKPGDKVIRYDGMTGKVVREKNSPFPTAKFDFRGLEILIRPESLNLFYLLGKTVIGNKVEPECLECQIEKRRAEFDQLRKQLWYLKNKMTAAEQPPEDKPEQ